MTLPVRALKILEGVHPDLARVISHAADLSGVAFTVTEGRRTLERQKQLKAAGASLTLKSRHLTGHAVDVAALVNGKIRWDWPLYSRIAAVVKASADELRIPIVWGGDWTHFRDGPHFELPHKEYPA
jgi:peptidoglycan LD-endopeptidase CwlK